MKYETVTIYYNMSIGRYIVQPMARHPYGASGEFGEPAELSEEDFEARIVPLVLENLSKYHKQKYVRDLAPSRPKEFGDSHYCVSVTRGDDGIVEVQPLLREKGGHVGLREHEITFSASEIDSKLPAAIRQAFERVAEYS